MDVGMFSLNMFSTLLLFFCKDLPLNLELDNLAQIGWLVGPWDLAAFAPNPLACSAGVTEMCSGALSSYVATKDPNTGPHVVSHNMVALQPQSLSPVPKAVPLKHELPSSATTMSLQCLHLVVYSVSSPS